MMLLPLTSLVLTHPLAFLGCFCCSWWIKWWSPWLYWFELVGNALGGIIKVLWKWKEPEIVKGLTTWENSAIRSKWMKSPYFPTYNVPWGITLALFLKGKRKKTRSFCVISNWVAAARDPSLLMDLLPPACCRFYWQVCLISGRNCSYCISCI